MNQENPILSYLEHLKRLTQGSKQGEVYAQALNKATEVEVLPTEEAIGKLLAQRIAMLDCRLKACYRNALLAAIALECDYVEGYMAYENMPFPFKHAWNFRDGKYFDPTADFALKTKEKRTYVQLIKVSYQQAYSITKRLGYTGNIFNEYIAQEVKHKTV